MTMPSSSWDSTASHCNHLPPLILREKHCANTLIHKGCLHLSLPSRPLSVPQRATIGSGLGGLDSAIPVDVGRSHKLATTIVPTILYLFLCILLWLCLPSTTVKSQPLLWTNRRHHPHCIPAPSCSLDCPTTIVLTTCRAVAGLAGWRQGRSPRGGRKAVLGFSEPAGLDNMGATKKIHIVI